MLHVEIGRHDEICNDKWIIIMHAYPAAGIML